MINLEHLALAYLQYYSQKRKEDHWAYDEVDDLIRDDPQRGWLITALLIEKAPSDEALAYVAAGPLEDLLNRHGSVVIEQIDRAAENNSRLQLALSGVWGIDPNHPVFERWYSMMQKYGFAEGKQQPL